MVSEGVATSASLFLFLELVLGARSFVVFAVFLLALSARDETFSGPDN